MYGELLYVLSEIQCVGTVVQLNGSANYPVVIWHVSIVPYMLEFWFLSLFWKVSSKINMFII